MSFKEEYILGLKPYTDKLISYFKNKEIEFIPIDGKLDNVIFKNKDKELKIAHHCFYGFSRMGCIVKEKANNEIEWIQVTDSMFFNSYMKAIIENYFFPKIKK